MASSDLIAGLGLVVALCGCGRIGFDADANADAGADADAPDGAGPLTYRQAVLDDHPAAYWRLADTDTVARDEVGGLDGAYHGSYAHVAGALAGDANTAARFDGMNGGIVSVDALSFEGTAPFSLEAWVRVFEAERYQHYITKEPRQAGGPITGYALFQGSGGIYFERVAETVSIYAPSYVLPVDQWSHVVGVYDGASLAMYVDGVAIGVPNPDTRSIAISTEPLRLAEQSEGVTADGVLDELAIYAYALSAERIALHHQLGITASRE